MRLFEHEWHQWKAFTDGTHRVRSPEETIRAYSPLMPRLGITRLANVTGLDCLGVPVYMSVRPNSRSISVSQGKGVSLAAAKASALMESIETWHAENMSVSVRREAYSTFHDSARVIDLERLPRRRQTLRSEVAMLWLEGYDISARAATWVPHEVVSLDLVGPGPTSGFHVGSDGLASGNHLLEAVVHGLCELIERDATALWLGVPDERTKETQVDLSTIQDAHCRALLDRFAAAGTHVALWDTTSDVGVPTYTCGLFDRPGWRAKGLAMGHGTHLAPEVAVARALTEAAQSRLTLIAGSRDDIEAHLYTAWADEHAIEYLATELFEPPPTRDFRARASLATDSFEGDLERLLAALAGVGLASVVVVNLTREDVGVPVVKVLVPGLELPSAAPGARVRALAAT